MPEPDADKAEMSQGAVVFLCCSACACLFLISGVIANGLLNGRWSLVGAGLGNRGSDTGFLAWMITVVLAGVMVSGMIWWRIMAVGWRHRRAASDAVRRQFDRGDQRLGPALGRTGGAHIRPRASER